MQKLYDIHGRIDHEVLCERVCAMPINEYYTVEDAAGQVGLAKGEASNGAISTAMLCGYELGKFVRKTVGGRMLHRRIGKFGNGELYDAVIWKRKASLRAKVKEAAEKGMAGKYTMKANPTVIKAEDKPPANDSVSGAALPSLFKHLESARVAATMLDEELRQAEACYNRIKRVIG